MTSYHSNPCAAVVKILFSSMGELDTLGGGYCGQSRNSGVRKY